MIAHDLLDFSHDAPVAAFLQDRVGFLELAEVVGTAVEATGEGDHPVAPGEAARGAHGTHHRFGAGVCEAHLLDVGAQRLGQGHHLVVEVELRG